MTEQISNYFLSDPYIGIDMDEYSSKRVVGGLGLNKKGSSFSFRENHEAKSTQYCNRLGCSTRHYCLKGIQTGIQEKFKLSKPAFLSSSSRLTVASSIIPSNDHGRPQRVRRNTSSLQERITVESSSRQEQKEYIQSNIRQEVVKVDVEPTIAAIQTISSEPEGVEPSILQKYTAIGTEASRTCQVTSSLRNRQTNSRKTESGKQGATSSSSVRRSVVSKNANHIINPSRNPGANAQKYGLKNLSCTSISDVLPSGCSSVRYNKMTDPLRKRYIDEDHSEARGKRTVGSSTGGNPESPRNGPGVSFLEKPLPQPASRRTRNQLSSRDDVLSVRTRRPANKDNRTRFSERVDDSSYFLPEPLAMPPPSQAQISPSEAASTSLSQSFPAYIAPICHSSSGQADPSNGITRSRQIANSEDGNNRHDRWVDGDGYRHLNIERIEELSLERTEQDEELTFEQLMGLQSNVFVGGIGFHDEHRAWRLDIDDMSYEELLALEEKMGTVSTALSEEEILKCLERSIFEPITELGIIGGDEENDVKCSICQEEYIEGDEVGKLHCHHHYHKACIHQWLQQKNWCPICKSSACATS
uniref:RING-type E3 ubiquitin transferase n=1 Tax=Anthurium amnicola TaxID=1678845 RepID=A0A1D1Z1W7_9ARAE